MSNAPTRANPESTLFPRSSLRAFLLIPPVPVAMGATSAFAQTPASAPSAPATSVAQPMAPPAQPMPAATQPPAPVPRPYYPTPPPGYPLPRPYPPAEPAPRPEPSFLSGSIAGGLGIPYGVLGAGVSFGFDYLSLLGGVGTTVFAGAGYSGGLRLYFLDTSHRWRPHFTAVYGTTTYYKITVLGGDDMTGVLRGFAFYAGLDQSFGELGRWFATYGVGVITHEKLPASVTDALGYTPEMGNRVKFMVGIGYRFGGQ